MNLIQARKNARYSQQQVADHLGISRPTYAKMESDPDIVSVDDAKKLSKLFGVSVNEIFFKSNYS